MYPGQNASLREALAGASQEARDEVGKAIVAAYAGQLFDSQDRRKRAREMNYWSSFLFAGIGLMLSIFLFGKYFPGGLDSLWLAITIWLAVFWISGLVLDCLNTGPPSPPLPLSDHKRKTY